MTPMKNKRSFTDLYTEPSSREEAYKIILYSKKLGYSWIGVKKDSIPETWQVSQEKINVVEVNRIEAESEKEAKSKLNKLNGQREIVIGKAKGPGALRVFSRDSRVRVLELTPRLTVLLDKNQATLMKMGETYLGINLSIIKKNPAMLSWFEAVIARALKHGIKIIVYSGARNWSYLWHPRTIVSLITSIGFPKEIAFTATSSEIIPINTRVEGKTIQ